MTEPETGTAYLRRIVAEPDDDLPRLEYADYLEEQAKEVSCPKCRGTGEGRHPNGIMQQVSCKLCHGTGRVQDNTTTDRAAFIRMQCGQIDFDPDRYDELCKTFFRNQQPPVYGDGYVRWHKGKAGITATKYRTTPLPSRKFTARRGFIEVVSTTWKLDHVRSLIDNHPIRMVNRGTEDKPNWRGGGSVTLTTVPELIEVRTYQADDRSAIRETNNPAAGIDGLLDKTLRWPSQIGTDLMTLYLLRENFPGVRFILESRTHDGVYHTEIPWPGTNDDVPTMCAYQPPGLRSMPGRAAETT